MLGLLSSWPRWMSLSFKVVMGFSQRQQSVMPGM